MACLKPATSGAVSTPPLDHPAFRCPGYASLLNHLRSHGVEAVEVNDIPEVRRCHIVDPFGNRTELVAD
jgi:hypothetical protein